MQKLPSQPCGEHLHNNIFEADALAHVAGIAEDKNMSNKLLEPPRHRGMHLDSSITIQTKTCLPTPE